MNTLKFTDLNLMPPLQLALKESGYEIPTPIQLQAIPLVLQGHDLLGIAQTGTGKTAAFSLPILQLLHERRTPREAKSPRALILTPTRELAIQIHKSMETYGRHMKQKHVVIFGGVAQGKQVRDIAQGADVLVATPGRLVDLIQHRFIKLDRVEIFVLDEADRMLDMGFIRDIKKLIPLLPKKKHSLFFSATMPPEIQKLAEAILHEPKKIEVTPESTTVEKIQQSVMYVEKKDKMNLLIHLLKSHKLNKVLVFVEMKHIANKVVEGLQQNRITAAAIHGNKSQGARQRAIEDFSNDKARVLVATDIASRGIDIDGISHVINFELPNIPESYVHRIGRTARAGSNGDAISLVTSEEKAYLQAIERSTRQKIDVDIDQPYHSESAARSVGVRPPPRGGQGRGGGGGGRRGGGGGSNRPKSSASSRPRR
jgi:ATP-dependent RNA helicase RhlE